MTGSSLKIAESESAAPSLPEIEVIALVPAGFWIRFVAFVVDATILMLINSPVSFTFQKIFGVTDGMMQRVQQSGQIPAELVTFYIFSLLGTALIAFAYYYTFYQYKAATPGKMLFKLKVYKKDEEEPVGWLSVIMREFIGKFIGLFFMFGYLMAAFNKEKKGLHDYISGSRVIKE